MPSRFQLNLFSRVVALALFSPLLLAEVAAPSAPAAVQTVLTRASAPDRALAIALMRDLAANRAQYRSDMRPMYHNMEYRGLWVNPSSGNISGAGAEALATLASARQWGLLNNYATGLPNISAKRQYSPPQLAQLELKITNAVLRLLADLANGQLDQGNPELGWGIAPVRVSFRQLMTELSKGTPVPKLAELLSEQRFGQAKLLAELANYDDIVAKGGWPLVLSDKILKPGMVDAAVVTLRRRLAIEGYNTPPLQQGQAAPLYDRALADVVRRFQASHGLKADGEIGPTTQLALNLPAQLRRDQILANLERLRWLPQELGASRVWVNIPAFRLHLVDNEKIKLDMGVIVGRKERSTPVFDDLISQVEVNPTWNVPTTIAFEDYLPELRKNPLYLQKKNIRVFENWKASAKELDPREVNWQDVNDRKRNWFPYRLTQDPGGNNALGRVKFLFPNRHNVYLHDTPERHLFNRQSRDFSSGCVRVEEPAALAEYLLGELTSSSVSYAQLRASKRTKRLFLDGSLPVYLAYFTAWVDEFGQLQFRDDIYGHDRPLLQMLGSISAQNPRAHPLPLSVPRKPATTVVTNTKPIESVPVTKAPASNLKLKSADKLRQANAKPAVPGSKPGEVAKNSLVAATRSKPAAVKLVTEEKATQPVVNVKRVFVGAGNKTEAKKSVAGTALKVSAGQLGGVQSKSAKGVTVVPIVGTNQVVLTKSEARPATRQKPALRPVQVPTRNTARPILVKTRLKPVLARGEAVVVVPPRPAVKQALRTPLPATKQVTPDGSGKVLASKPTEKRPVEPALKLNQSRVVQPAIQPLPVMIKPRPVLQKSVEAPATSKVVETPGEVATSERSNSRYRAGPRAR